MSDAVVDVDAAAAPAPADPQVDVVPEPVEEEGDGGVEEEGGAAAAPHEDAGPAGSAPTQDAIKQLKTMYLSMVDDVKRGRAAELLSGAAERMAALLAALHTVQDMLSINQAKQCALSSATVCRLLFKFAVKPGTAEDLSRVRSCPIARHSPLWRSWLLPLIPSPSLPTPSAAHSCPPIRAVLCGCGDGAKAHLPLLGRG